MKKKIIIRALLGFPLGVFIGYGITIWISAILGDGTFHPVVPALIKECGSEMGAVVLQFVLSGVMGASFAAASCVFECESWSILKQSLIHCAILSATLFPIAYFTYWMPRSAVGIISYFAIFFGLYIVIWIIQYFAWKKKIVAMNKKLKEKR
ncbi:MAG: DUF3021 domain-containing protein [Eubacteriales bacterium]